MGVNMDKTAAFIVKHRYPLLLGALILSILSGVLALRVPINTDMTKYLPDDSSMKQGIDLMAEEFSDLSVQNTIRVMFENLSEEDEDSVLEKLQEMPYVSAAVLASRKEHEGNAYTLFTLSTDYDYQSPEELSIEHGIPDQFPDAAVTVRNDNTSGMEIPFFIFVVAAVFLFVVLFAMCGSWAEPFLFLAAIGIAIILNMGSNMILGSVAQVTWSIAAVLQLVLSMDYSIILMNRFRQEKQSLSDPEEAMRRALKRAFSSVASSGFTTFVGLLMLVFMRFKIGKDIGLVLAKGVLLSMLCVLFVLPSLILLFNGLVEKTEKPVLKVPTDALSSFSFRFRRVLAVGFVVLFFGAFYLERLAGISYSLSPDDPISRIFEKENQIVVLYANEDEAAVFPLTEQWEESPHVHTVISYANTLGRKMTPDEMAVYILGMMQGEGGSYASIMISGMGDFGSYEGVGEDLSNLISGDTLGTIYQLYGLRKGVAAEKLSIEELYDFIRENLQNPVIAALLGKNMTAMIEDAGDIFASIKAQMVGPKHALIMLGTDLPAESEETEAFIKALQEDLRSAAGNDCYLVGSSVMSKEMKDSFGRELLTISLLTAASIFLVVMLTFRQLVVPAILVLLVQCGVFLTVSTTWLMGYRMYYLALLIVQCILMGATVDYGILYTNYYREMRKTCGPAEALREAYRRSVHTILTSSLFMIIVTGAIGLSPAEPTIAQICMSISIGTAAATILVIFVLPGILASLDRFVAAP